MGHRVAHTRSSRRRNARGLDQEASDKAGWHQGGSAAGAGLRLGGASEKGLGRRDPKVGGLDSGRA